VSEQPALLRGKSGGRVPAYRQAGHHLHKKTYF